LKPLAGETAMALIGVSFWASLLNFFIIALGLILILIVLIQRGKGGGLAGAFGGAGGSSAFGSRTGDAFTKITITIAALWVLLIMIQVKVVKWDAGDKGGIYAKQSN
jgi:preprotein translocase subunit SecG